LGQGSSQVLNIKPRDEGTLTFVVAHSGYLSAEESHSVWPRAGAFSLPRWFQCRTLLQPSGTSAKSDQSVTGTFPEFALPVGLRCWRGWKIPKQQSLLFRTDLMLYSRLMWLSAIRDPPVMHAGCPPRNALPLRG